MPISAEPAPDITDFTSAKSRLISPGVVMRSVIPAHRRAGTWSAALNASSTLTCRSEMDSRRSSGMTISVSTSLRSFSMPGPGSRRSQAALIVAPGLAGVRGEG